VKKTLLLLLLMVPGLAMAENHGSFDCGSDCLLGRPLVDPDTLVFIQSVANQSISAWHSGDTITICNTTTCASYRLTSVVAGLTSLAFIGEVSRSVVFPAGGSGGGGMPPDLFWNGAGWYLGYQVVCTVGGVRISCEDETDFH
jgi:hypothetical protein